MSAEILIDEGFAHHKKGKFKEAEALYRAALETDVDNFQALQLLGTLALNNGRISEALMLLARALAILENRGDEAQRHAALYNNLGIALRASGQCADAAEKFRHGLTLDPALPELHVSLGGALMELGDIAGAIQSYETALSLNPALPGSLCDLGTLYAQGGRLADAVVLYRRVLAIDPHHAAAQKNLAQILGIMKEADRKGQLG